MAGTPPRRLRRSLLSSLLLVSTLSLSVAASASPLIEDNILGVFDLSNSDFDDPLDPRHSFEESATFELYDDESSVWHHHGKRALGKAWTGTTKLAQAGTSGVGAMQVSVVDDDHILILDKAENNALKAKNGKSAWGAIYTISTKKIRALNLKTNSFCAGGGWLSNGTMASLGGNPVQSYMNDAAGNGLAAVRLFTPCDDDKCDVYENPARIRLTSARWYPSTVRLHDGSLMVLGGMIAGGFNNAEATDNPTFEFYPPKGNGLQFYSKFLHDLQALDSNLFPITYLLPDGTIFVAANHIAMIYNWKKNTEKRLPSFPNGATVTYPSSAPNALLPLTIANNWTPEVFICGGTAPSVNLDGNPSKLSSKTNTSKNCYRMAITTAGIKKGWIVEAMPEARMMGDMVLTPDGKVFLVNGARSGIAGYGNVPDTIGASNSRNPTFRPTLYDPLLAKGKRFSTNFPSSKIERLYHSSATLMPDGRIFVSGSNPNDAVSTTTYKTRYEVEIFSPPYVALTRPTFSGIPKYMLYNHYYTLTVNIPSGTKKVTAVIMDLGYSTHGIHMNNRNVELKVTLSGKKLKVLAPRTNGVYPPGYAWIYVLADGVPSVGQRVMIGKFQQPPVSQSAIKNMLAKTKGA